MAAFGPDTYFANRPIADLDDEVQAASAKWGWQMMTKSSDLIRLVVFSVAAMVVAAALNLLIDVGARLHDIFCVTHGWFS